MPMQQLKTDSMCHAQRMLPLLAEPQQLNLYSNSTAHAPAAARDMHQRMNAGKASAV